MEEPPSALDGVQGDIERGERRGLKNFQLFQMFPIVPGVSLIVERSELALSL